MVDPYQNREQTKAKHFILKGYLQALAFKILRFSDLTYVDGFSGPWETTTEDFADSSFMIAIESLKDAQRKILEETGRRRKIRCFLSERDTQAFTKLEKAVASHHRPREHFEIKTYNGKFEDAVGEIETFIGTSFALIFIDPTGWAGYPFEKIKLLFARRKCEVLINFMYSFIIRFIEAEDESIVASLEPILGGPGWRGRLDKSLPRAVALVKLFRDTLKAAGNFDCVVSTKIDKATEDHPHFLIAYGTKAYAGLKAFRDIEYKALRSHAANRAHAKDRKREERTGSSDLFADHEAEIQESSIDEIVNNEKQRAAADLMQMLQISNRLRFSNIVKYLLETYMLRETDVKNIIVELARAGKVEHSWGRGNSKPGGSDLIQLSR